MKGTKAPDHSHDKNREQQLKHSVEAKIFNFIGNTYTLKIGYGTFPKTKCCSMTLMRQWKCIVILEAVKLIGAKID